jgi:hypothetical protein
VRSKIAIEVKKLPSLVEIAMENQKPSTFSRNNYHNAKIYQKKNSDQNQYFINTGLKNS